VYLRRRPFTPPLASCLSGDLARLRDKARQEDVPFQCRYSPPVPN
jgi:hypothetical protein